MSYLKVVMLKINYCPHLLILNRNVIMGGLLPLPTAEDEHRV